MCCFYFPQVYSTLPLDKTLVIYAKQRTGSSFTASFFASDPQVTFLFEPLNFLEGTSIPWNALLEEFVSCNFSRLLYYNLNDRWWTKQIFCNFDAVSGMTTHCGDKRRPAVWRKACRKNPYVVAKVIKLPNVSDLQSAMERGQRVIVLLRDPRGVWMSRMGIHRYRNKSDQITDLTSYCKSMHQDLVWIKNQIQLHRCATKRLVLLRYEDLAKDPMTEIKRMYSFLGRSFPQKVETWAKKLISGAAVGTKYQFRNFNIQREDPLQTAWGWRQGMTWRAAETVQRICRKYMDMAGYKTVDSVGRLKDASYSLTEHGEWNNILFKWRIMYSIRKCLQ